MPHVACTQDALWLLKLLSYPGHERVIIRLISLGLEVVHDFDVALDLSLAECILQELSGLPLLLHLLFEHVADQVLVALHEALGILESVLELLLSVSLYALQQSAQSELLSLAEESLALHDLRGRHGRDGLTLASLELVATKAKLLCQLVVFY